MPRGKSPNADTFRIDVTNNNGAAWINARTVGPATDNDGGWISDSVELSAIINPTNAMRIRFVADDAGTGSLVEAAVDDIAIVVRRCTQPAPSCPADFNEDGFVNPDDLADYITCFFLNVQFPGTCPGADFNGDAFVNPDDLADFITTFFTANC